MEVQPTETQPTEVQPIDIQPTQAQAKKISPVFVGFLLVVIVALTAMNVLQNRVIQKQRGEIRWLLSQGINLHLAPAVPAANPPAGDAAVAKPEK